MPSLSLSMLICNYQLNYQHLLPSGSNAKQGLFVTLKQDSSKPVAMTGLCLWA